MKRYLLCTLFISALAITARADDLRGDTIAISSYLLRLDFTDFAGKVMDASATMAIKAKMDNVNGIRLDLLRLTVDSVKVNGATPVYSYNDTVVNIMLPL